MARIKEVASLVREGYSPSEIPQKLDPPVSMSSVKQYINSAIGAGLIKGSDVIFTIPPEDRELIEATIQATNSTYWFDLYKQARATGHSLDADNLKIYLKFSDTGGGGPVYAPDKILCSSYLNSRH